MYFKNYLPRVAFLLILIIAGAAICNAKDDDPRWINDDEKELNKGVGNDSYSIHVLRAHSPSERQIVPERKRALAKYVVEEFGAVETSVHIDSVSGGEQPVFWVYYNTPSSDNNFVAAKLIDQYSKFTDEMLNSYEYEFYYLLAISEPDTYPSYDEFINYKPSKSKAIALSVVPGLGQFYKGHNIKGALILGGEAAFIGAAIIFERKHIYCKNKVGIYDDVSAPTNWDSWHSKSRTWSTWRNGAIACALGIYVYNFIDAARSPGRGNFKVKKLMADHLAVSPFLTPDFSGFSMRITF